MLFAPEKLYFKLVFAFLLIFTAVNFGFAQKKKPVLKQSVSKNQPLVKKTSSVKETISKSKSDGKMNRAETARLAEIKRTEENRRRAALETQRRREQINRESQSRKLNFESGLRRQTVENITGDNIDGEDLEVRRAAINALGNHAGTVVVLEPQTGRILTIINQDWAITKSFKPCSTIKLVTAVAGLNEKVINQDGNIAQSSFPVALDDALAFSNNAYFQRVGAGLGGQKMVSYARILGLGEPTGLNVEGETSGRVPVNNNNARIYSHGDDFEVTPLQLAVLVSAISNGGRLVVPQIPRTKIEKANFRGFMKRQIPLPPISLQRVIPGMIGAASYGTARRGVDSSLEIAGKTGSCIGQGSWLGLFASVAPIENPRLAVVVILRGQGERGKYAAAVAGSIYNSLRNRLKIDGNKNLAKLPLQIKPQSKVDAKTSAEFDDAETDDSDDNGTPRQGKKGDENVLKTSSTSKTVANQTKNPDKTDNQKQTPLFPTIIITKKEEITRPRVVRTNK
ncbi:MAG: penicillin-binding transpeptidase domain-containing protein [Actinomycetota bacterium]